MRHWHDIQLQSDCFRSSVIKGPWILEIFVSPQSNGLANKGF